MWIQIYRIGMLMLRTLIGLASLKNKKAAKRIQGAQQFQHDWEKALNKPLEGRRYWFHCASLGEFDAIIPVIQALKAAEPCSILVSFFSPSGFEKRHNHPLIDAAAYLPWDTPANAHKLITLLKPDVAVFVKYEFWLHIFEALHQSKIPILVCGVRFAEKSAYFGKFAGLYRKIFSHVTLFLTQDKASYEQLQRRGYANSMFAGDTRIDQCIQIANMQISYPDLEKCIAGREVWIIGSTWPEDERFWLPLWHQMESKPFLIVAPHELGEKRLQSLEMNIAVSAQRWSKIKPNPNSDAIVVDTIGHLPFLYKYAQIAYVGGAFGKGLHNILEPLAFGVPVLFGPDIRKFPEALDAQKHGFGLSIRDTETLDQGYKYFTQTKSVKLRIQSYLTQHAGASTKVADIIQKAK